ncbi:TPR-like protein [Rhodocollybia butyracea]|uniref:TPR-like protein n=1 Tax=Rhodocollybia butyracea TaxID=206335 RepID=A0A9P5U7S9_9AGAR|nr:TPR-like protein [Rhodocollybia butyracea]
MRRRFEQRGELADIDKAINFLEMSVELTPDGDPDKPSSLSALGSAFQSRFRHLGRHTDIEEAIRYKQQAVDLTPDGHSDKPSWIANLGITFQSRFERFGNLEDIEQAIRLKQQALTLTPDGHPDKPGWFNSVGTAYRRRFERLGDPADLEQAITALQQAVELTPDDDADKPGWLNNLGNALQNHFERFGGLAYIDQAIQFKQRAVDLTPNGHAIKPSWIANLGSSFELRFDWVGKLTDIEQAIRLKQQAVDLTPSGHVDSPRRLCYLGDAFLRRFGYLGELKDIEQAIDVMQQAVDLTPDDHAEKPLWLNNLGGAFNVRFDKFGELPDSDKAIAFYQEALNLTPDGHAAKPSRLTNLGTAFQWRYEHLGDLADNEQAIGHLRLAVELTPDGHVKRPTFVANLATALQTRYKHLEELTDIRQAIDLLRQTVILIPDSHISKAMYLDALGTAFQLRFEKLHELSDIEEAIYFHQQAVDQTPDGYAYRPGRLTNLGTAFQCRFNQVGNPTDIAQAIDFQQQAVNLTPDGHAVKPSLLTNLGNSFRSRYKHLSELTDIEQTIYFTQRAVDLTPDGHSNKAGWLINLGHSYKCRFDHLANASDHDQASSAFQNASVSLNGRPFIRLQAALQWASLCLDPHLALQAYDQMFQLIPRAVWLGQTVSHRIERLPRLGRAVNAAVATAISVGQYSKAVEWLEDGRGVLWGQILQLRSPLDDLRNQHPQIAENLQTVSRALETAGRTSRSNHISFDIEQEAQRHTKLAREYESVLTDIRGRDGFEDFFMPRKLPELVHAAKNGHVVIVNVDSLRCDAIVLPRSSSSVVHTPLPNFSLKQCQDLRSKMIWSLNMSVHIGRNGDRLKVKTPSTVSKDDRHHDFQAVLADLWLNVVQPVLSLLGLLETDAKNPLPTITWCATGALAFLPLHAAGIYGSGNPKQNVKTSDFVISSYTTTLTALINSGSKTRTNSDRTLRPKVLIVSQPLTPGMDPLPGTLEEAKEIENCISSDRITHLTHDQATINAVMNEINKHAIIHLACHGIQDLNDPLNSCFALYDGELHLQALMGLSLENAQLAVLSACQTATGDERLPEEAVHLAAGMLSIGYPSVIATMWSIEDQEAPRVVAEVYSRLFQNRDDKGRHKGTVSSAYALHEAINHLREQVGDMNFAKWVPFVHYGI